MGALQSLPLNLSTATLSSSTTPSSTMTFDGAWKVDRNDNYDKFMEQMGINMVKRKLAEHDNLKVIITQTGNDFHVKESSTFRTKDINFTLGVEFEYSLADGTELKGSWQMEGATLKGVFAQRQREDPHHHPKHRGRGACAELQL